MEIWFNPACSKCRAATGALDAAGITYTVRRYLEQPPTAEELERTLTALGLEPWEITRTGDAAARELGVAGWPKERERWITLLVEHPTLIQRPILIGSDGSARIGRTTEALAEAIDSEALAEAISTKALAEAIDSEAP